MTSGSPPIIKNMKFHTEDGIIDEKDEQLMELKAADRKERGLRVQERQEKAMEF